MTTKTCTKCGVEKPLDQYHRNKSRKDGRASQCGECARASHADYRSRPEAKAAKAAYDAKYREANRGRKLAQDAAYYLANRETMLAQMAERAARPEVKAARAAYLAANPHLGWESQARGRARRYGLQITVQHFTREQLIDRYGDQCFHCGREFEELDHYPTPISRGGHHVIDNCKPSCVSCNRLSWRIDSEAA